MMLAILYNQAVILHGHSVKKIETSRSLLLTRTRQVVYALITFVSFFLILLTN